MNHASRILIAVLIVFVAGVVWYAVSGQAFLAKTTFTNDATIAAGTTWVRSDRGLDGGPVTAIAALSSQPAVVYAGTKADEMYVSSDGGARWSRLGGISTGHYIAGIVAEPATGGTNVGKAVYGEGFFLSGDGGRTWKSAGRGLHSRSLSCLAAASDSPEILFVGTGDTGLYVSRDGGHSWNSTGRSSVGDRIACVTVSRDGSTVYAGTLDNGLFVSHDSGVTWAEITLLSGSQPAVTGADIDPADDMRIAVCVTGGGVDVSADGGKTWSPSRTGSLPSDCATVQFIPGDGAGLVTGTQSGTLHFSHDGMEWRVVHGLPDGGRVFQLTRIGDGVVAATSHGVFSSADGKTWQESSTGISNLTLAGLAISSADPARMFAATDDGVYRSMDAGLSWSRSSASASIMSVLVLSDGDTVLAGTAKGAVLRSTDGGTTWNSVTRGIPGMRVGILAAPPGKPRTVYAGTDDGFAVSEDGGQTWEPRNIGLAQVVSAGSPASRTEVAALLPDAGHPGTVFLSLLGRGLYVSSDEGLRWKPVQPGPPTPWIDSLAQDVSAGRIYAGTDTNGVTVSSDEGVTWSPSGKGLSTPFAVSGPVNTVAVAADGTVYAGTVSRGVARSDDGGVSWQRLNGGLPDINIRRIVAGTHVYAVTAHCVMRLQTQ